MKRIPVIFFALISAACTTFQRTPWSPLAPCALTGFADTGGYQSAQIGFVSDGLKIGGLLTKPKGDGPFAVYVHNHGAMTREQAGGPLWRTAGEIESRLAAAGYVVLRVARRGYLGSEGLATTYWVRGSPLRVADVIKGAYDEARDVNAAIEYLSQCPFVDRTRIAVGGHSLGGLVAVIAAAKNPHVAGLVSVNGGIAWIQNGIQQGFAAVREVWRAEAAGLSAPALLLHGQDDAVITPELSRELAALLQQRAAPVTLKIFPGDHSVYPIDEIVNFLDGTVKRR